MTIAAIIVGWTVLGLAVSFVFGAASLIGRRPGE